jgi:hypothetical protein
MNTKFNQWFEQTAADPARRRAAILDFTRRRIVLFICAALVTVCAIGMHFTPARNPNSPALISLSAALLWLVVFRIDSQRRALVLVDRFDQNKDPKPAA